MSSGDELCDHLDERRLVLRADRPDAAAQRRRRATTSCSSSRRVGADREPRSAPASPVARPRCARRARSRPSSSASSGLMSSSATSGRSATSCDSLTSVSGDRVEIRRRPVAVAAEQPGDPRAGDQLARRARMLSGGRPIARSRDHLDRRAALAEEHDRAERGVVGDAERSAPAPRGRWTICCTVKPSIARRGRTPARTVASISRGGRLDRLGRARGRGATPPTSDLWVMSGDRIFSATGHADLAARRRPPRPGRRRSRVSHDRDAVGGEHRLGLRLGQHAAARRRAPWRSRRGPRRGRARDCRGPAGGVSSRSSWLRR